jgi:hypothetical protein
MAAGQALQRQCHTGGSQAEDLDVINRTRVVATTHPRIARNVMLTVIQVQLESSLTVYRSTICGRLLDKV